MSIIGLLISLAPVVVKLFDLFLDKIGASKEARKNFLRTVDALGNQGIISQELRSNYAAQLKDLENANDNAETASAE